MTKSIFMEKFTKRDKKFLLEKMVQEIEREFPLEDSIRKALLSIDREEFVPPMFKHFAYKLDALPMDNKQWISSPLTVAKMTQYLNPKGADSVLEIGCGSGYQAAILSQLFRRVFTIERINGLLLKARERFRKFGITNVNSKFDDGNYGWVQFAPFDRILYSASPTNIPKTIFNQLADGGILVAPVDTGGVQKIMRFYKRDGVISSEVLEDCNFVPVLKGTIY